MATSLRPAGKYYPVQLFFSYTALRRGQVIQRGSGETIEMSKSHIRARTLDILSPRATTVVMSITWPAKLADGTGLQLMVQTKPDRDALQLGQFCILKHEFRTAPKVGHAFGLRTALEASKADDSGEPVRLSLPARSMAAESGR
jgi:hypothetical protein